jgi:hypothetical protein
MSLLSGFHKHHIVPRYRGGNNSPENLVLLHPIDHAITHLVRFKIFGHHADGWAYNRLINGLKDELFPSLKGVAKPYMKKPKTPEVKAKMSASAKGKPKTAEAIEKMRKALTGRPATELQLSCLALGRSRPADYVSPLKGKKRETPWMLGRVPANKGKKASDELKQHLSNIRKGRKQTAEQIAKRVASRRATLESQGRTR